MNPLITGSAGGVGRNALLRLPRGWAISARYRSDGGAFARFLERPTQALGMETRITHQGEPAEVTPCSADSHSGAWRSKGAPHDIAQRRIYTQAPDA